MTVAGLLYEPDETKHEDGFDQHHQSEQQPLALADENNDAGEDQRGSEGQRVDGEAKGHPCAAHTGPEAKAQRFSAGVAWHTVGSGGLKSVELLPGVPFLILIGHASIIPTDIDAARLIPDNRWANLHQRRCIPQPVLPPAGR